MANLIVVKGLKEYVKTKQMNSSKDLSEGLEAEVKNLIDKAAARVTAYNKKTIGKRDL